MFKLNPIHIRLQPKERLYHCPVPIIAITGSIATGKSSVSRILKKAKYSLIDADQLVKTIYKKDELIDIVSTHCPKAYIEREINFKILREHFFNNDSLRLLLETTLYSHLEVEFKLRAEEAMNNGAEFIFYDVPLLFEKNMQNTVDLTVTVYTPRDLQLSRLIARDKIDMELAEKLIRSQMDIEEKKQKSHLIINNDSTLRNLENEVLKFLDILKKN